MYKPFKAFLRGPDAEGAATKDINSSSFEEKIHKKFFPLPMQSNYIIETFPIPHFTHEDTPKLHVLCKIKKIIKALIFFQLKYCPQTSSKKKSKKWEEPMAQEPISVKTAL